MSDTQRLLTDAQDGDLAALDELLERHRGRLTALVASRMNPGLRGYIEPDDIVQEASLEAARKIANFVNAHPRGFYLWLVEIAKYKLMEAERHRTAKKRGNPQSLQGEPPADQTSASRRLGRSENALRIADALALLPQDQAAAVQLRYFEGLTVAETAERLLKSEAAVKALVARGLAQLAVRLRQVS